MPRDGAPEGAAEAAAGQRAPDAGVVARVRAAPREALRGVVLQAPVDEDEALQQALVGDRAAARAAALRSRYGRIARPRYDDASSASAISSSASSAGTSTGAGVASASLAGTSSVGWSASAWWESSPQ